MEETEDTAAYLSGKFVNSINSNCDSGVGSLGYFSGELNSEPDPADFHVGGNLVSLESSLSKLNIEGANHKQEVKGQADRLDSGLSERCLSATKLVSNRALFQAPAGKLNPDVSGGPLEYIFRKDEDGDNHLHMSIIHGIVEVTMEIIRLVPHWEWLNHVNHLHQTALHLAVLTRQLSVVRRLICAGASADLRDQLGNTPLHNACRLGFEDIVETLLRPVEYGEIQQNSYEIPYQRLPQDLECRNYEGLTCLHLAAIGGHMGVMELLLKAGANINAAEGKSGRTVLHLAAEWGNLAMIHCILSQQRTDINIKTYAGLSPILLAYGRGNLEVVDELYSRGAMCDSLSLSEDSDDDMADDSMEDSAPTRCFAVMSC